MLGGCNSVTTSSDLKRYKSINLDLAKGSKYTDSRS